MSIAITLSFIVGLMLGIAVDARSRNERDQRIKELEQRVQELSDAAPPVRVCGDAMRRVDINK